MAAPDGSTSPDLADQESSGLYNRSAMSPFMSNSPSPSALSIGSFGPEKENNPARQADGGKLQSSQSISFATDSAAVVATAAPVSLSSPTSLAFSNPYIRRGAPFVKEAFLLNESKDDDDFDSKEMLSKYTMQLASKAPYLQQQQYAQQYQQHQKYLSHAMNPFSDESLSECSFKLPSNGSQFEQFGRNAGAYYHPYSTAQSQSLATVLSMSPPISATTSISSPADSEPATGVSSSKLALEQCNKSDQESETKSMPGNNNEQHTNDKCDEPKKPAKVRNKKSATAPNSNSNNSKSRKQQSSSKRRVSKDSYDSSTSSSRNDTDQGSEKGIEMTYPAMSYPEYSGAFPHSFFAGSNCDLAQVTGPGNQSNGETQVTMARLNNQPYFMASTGGQSTAPASVSSHFYW